MKKKIALFLVVLICMVSFIGSFATINTINEPAQEKETINTKSHGCPNPKCPGRIYRYGDGWKCDTCNIFFYM